LELEENREQIQWFCQSHPDFELMDWRLYLPQSLEFHLEDTQSPWATILPIAGGGDGFFICRLERNK
jgi:16S rRNA C967 or C1407 C5-methylase (RsmB/RsmF family)